MSFIEKPQERSGIAVLALAMTIVTLGLSAYGVLSIEFLKREFRSSQEEAAFNAKVEKGIEAFIRKQSGQPDPAAAAPVDVSVDDDPVKGDPKAPVTIVEFSDFECPFCGRHFQQTLPQIEENYIKTGKVKYVFRDFPLGFHPNAMPAALAANCVRDQKGDEGFWKMHDLLYSNQKALDTESLKKYAGEAGADAAKFTQCMTAKTFEAEVNKDAADGKSYGVQGTPGFFVNGKPISGAQPFSVFQSAIEAALK